jgi:hypothetical protein
MNLKKRIVGNYKTIQIFFPQSTILGKTYIRNRHILSDCYSKYQIVGLKNFHFIFFCYNTE